MKDLKDLELRITQQKGRWGYIIELGTDRYGKRQQKTSFRYDFRKEAKAAGEAWLKEYKEKKGFLETDANIDLAELVRLFFLVYDTRDDIKPSTKLTRHESVTRPLKEFGAIPIQELTKADHQALVNAMIQEGRSQHTINRVMHTLKMIYKFAIQKGILAQNPLDGIVLKKPKIIADDIFEEPVPVFLELDELLEFLEIAEDTLNARWYMAFYLLAHTGMRPGELLALKWKDINLSTKKINIYKTIHWEPGSDRQYVLLSSKTKSGYRQITISDKCCEVLADWKEKQQRERSLSVQWHDGDFVLTNMTRSGLPSKHNALSRQMNKVLEWMRLDKKITPHKLRHTHISLLAQSGAPLAAIMDRVGHSDSKVTTRIYMHVTEMMENRALSDYEKMLEKREHSEGNTGKIVYISQL